MLVFNYIHDIMNFENIIMMILLNIKYNLQMPPCKIYKMFTNNLRLKLSESTFL